MKEKHSRFILQFIACIEGFTTGLFIYMCIIFSAMIAHHYGNIKYALPFTIAYALSKAILILFDHLNIVYRPFQTFIGLSLCLVLGSFSGIMMNPFWDMISGIFIGISASVCSPIINTCKNLFMEQKKWEYPKSGLYSIVWMVVLLVLFLLTIKMNFRYTFVLLSILSLMTLALSYYFYHKKKVDHIHIQRPPKTRRVYAAMVNFVFLFVVIFFVISLREFFNSVILLSCGILVLLAANYLLQQRKYWTHYQKVSLFIGSMQTYLIFSNIINFSLTQEKMKLVLTYILTLICIIAAIFIARKISKNTLYFLLIGGLLITVFFRGNLIGYTFSLLAISCINNRLNAHYAKDYSLFYRIKKAKDFSIGGIISQLFLLMMIIISSLLFNHNLSLLTDYIFRIHNTEANFIFTIINLVFTVAFLWILYLLRCKNKEKSGS